MDAWWVYGDARRTGIRFIDSRRSATGGLRGPVVSATTSS